MQLSGCEADHVDLIYFVLGYEPWKLDSAPDHMLCI
jgi:hypothetical protein